MWILSLELLLLAVLVFWCIGAFKRIKRLKNHYTQAFAPVQEQFVQIVEMMRNCARMQLLKEQVAGVFVPHAPQALLSSADVLESAVEQPGKRSIRPESVAALDVAWQSAQVAWQAYVQQCADKSEMHTEHVQEWSQRWQQLHTLQMHSLAQFNDAMAHYNQSIAQAPTCVVARLSGYRPGRSFQKDAALLMQPTA